MLIPTSCLKSIATSLSLKTSLSVEKIRDLIPSGAFTKSIVHREKLLKSLFLFAVNSWVGLAMNFSIAFEA